MAQGKDRSWTTLWDRKNRRVLLLAGQKSEGHWSFIRHDAESSVAGIYDIWREAGDKIEKETPPFPPGGEIVFVEIHLDDADKPLGFSERFAGRLFTSFIWWHGQG
jgi:hypothetical protein